MLMINIVCFFTAYCVVAVESVGRQIPIAFLDRVKEDFTKKYGGGKAATAAANSLNREFGCVPVVLFTQQSINHLDPLTFLTNIYLFLPLIKIKA